MTTSDGGQTARALLMELYQNTGGDMQQTVSMYDLGAAMGLSKAEAGAAGEELMMSGWAELRTLSGGIAITAEGLTALGVAATVPEPARGDQRRLGPGPLLHSDDRALLATLLAELRASLCTGQSVGKVEELIIDIKTLEVQLLSPAAKTAIVREILRSLAEALASGGDAGTAARLQRIIS